MEIKNGYDNRARLADALTDDLIELVTGGVRPQPDVIRERFEILKWLWEYELRGKMLMVGLEKCPVFCEGLRKTEEPDDEPDSEADDELNKEIKATIAAVWNTIKTIEDAAKKKQQ